MNPYRIAPVVDFCPKKLYNFHIPGLDQLWKESNGREFIVHDYVLNSMTPWECYYPTVPNDRIWFRRNNFDGCIFIRSLGENKV